MNQFKLAPICPVKQGHQHIVDQDKYSDNDKRDISEEFLPPRFGDIESEDRKQIDVAGEDKDA